MLKAKTDFIHVETALARRWLDVDNLERKEWFRLTITISMREVD